MACYLPHYGSRASVRVAPDDVGYGSLLMLGLPRDEAGEPYQVVLRLDDAGHPVGLLTDEEGQVMAWDAPERMDFKVRPVPSEVEQAAREQAATSFGL